jgi:hypothetical protein
MTKHRPPGVFRRTAGAMTAGALALPPTPAQADTTAKGDVIAAGRATQTTTLPGTSCTCTGWANAVIPAAGRAVVRRTRGVKPATAR